MKKIIAIGGAPGSGKSTLMKSIMKEIIKNKSDSWEFKEDFKLVPHYKSDNVYVLGSYPEGEVFGGTDKMSMAVQPEAIKFIEYLPKDSIIIFEGDRLFNNSFLTYCSDYDLSVIIIYADKVEKKVRFESRGSNQNEKWLEGRETKVNNIRGNLELMFVTDVFVNNTYDDQSKIVKHIMGKINE